MAVVVGEILVTYKLIDCNLNGVFFSYFFNLLIDFTCAIRKKKWMDFCVLG